MSTLGTARHHPAPLSLPLLAALLAGCGPSFVDVTRLRALSDFKTSSSPTGAAYHVEVDGNLAFVRDSYGLLVVKLNGGLDAEQVTLARVEPQSPQAGNSLALRPGLVALGHGARVVLFEYGADGVPSQVAAIQAGGTGVGRLAFDGDWLYFATYESGVKRVNVADPRAPGAVERVASGSAKSLLIEGGKLYIGGDEGLAIVALDAGFSRLGAVKVPTMSDLVLYRGRWLYGSVGDVGEVAIIDVAEPSNPLVIARGFGAGTNSTGLGFRGDQLLTSPATNGMLKDLDLRTPEAPAVRATTTPVQSAMGVVMDTLITERFLLVAHTQGFYIFGW